MQEITDQQRAFGLLEFRARGAETDYLVYRWLKSRWLLILWVAVGISFFAYQHVWVAMAFVLGMVLGVFARDAGYYVHAAEAWPFNEKVLNWDLIHAIASGTPAAGTEVAITVAEAPPKD